MTGLQAPAFQYAKKFYAKTPLPSSHLPPPSFFFLPPHKSFHKKKKETKIVSSVVAWLALGLLRIRETLLLPAIARAGGPRGGGGNPKRQKNGVNLIDLELEFYFPSIVLCMGVWQAMHALFLF